MIENFADAETGKIFDGRICRKLPQDIQRKARIKLLWIHAAAQILDLRVPPGNRLEKLAGDRAGRWSIRINDQWRICFRWTDDNNAADVEVVDYH